ncbi:MAG: hypothetical protein Q8861_13700 [Bacteroidota bacterium]|nr:hypothetical protein [Bacteroidota bacterium]
MNLRYIALYMDYDSGYEDPFRDNFNLHSRFISNYLSVQIRKLKYATDGTFNMLSIAPTIVIKHLCRIVGEKALHTCISFNRDAYEQMNDIEKYEYYLKLLEDGYRICAHYKNIPLADLLKLHDDFRQNNYKNEWLHKKKRIKEHGLDIILNCYFTSTDFRLVMTACDLVSKKELISGDVIRTLPDEVCFAHLFKDLKIENEHLIITDFLDRPIFSFLLSDLLNGKFKIIFMDNGLKYTPYLG